ncbi:energy-coupling factor transport system permease protein [Caloramator fervidus]|uniref:Energy-coupling factor transport system permease protein n=1 Tax=Caloramator fervidus TaxID=29344 RepID=A0A1H5SJ18_9CLOT|nr:energy-coupling factor transporter transmembrane component T [Caloramator fervidus]SEF50606.1 energy-coupling factor transport system permease protein [Caloramator fervidus]
MMQRKDKGGFNTFTYILIILLYLIVFIVLNNLLYDLIIMFSLILFAKINKILKETFGYIKFSLYLSILIIVLNLILNRNGNTILFKINGFYLTLESLIYSIFMSVRLIAILIVFAVGNILIDPDDVFSFISKIFGKTALVMSLVFRLSFKMIRQFNEIKEIEFIRGNTFEGNFLKRIKSYSQVINILFLSSLEDSIDLAEAMYSKGFGVSKRSNYNEVYLNFYDKVLIFLVIILFLNFITYLGLGYNKFSFFPTVDSFIKRTSFLGMFFSLSFFLITFVNWWCLNGSYKDK